MNGGPNDDKTNMADLVSELADMQQQSLPDESQPSQGITLPDEPQLNENQAIGVDGEVIDLGEELS